MRPDGTLRVPIGPGGTEERMPTVSPDGDYIAFIQVVRGSRRLSIRGFDGKSERVLLTGGWAEFPVW
jgi:Tol biopolymer transport system component